jgi:glycosyltransferase involved in cell wall biosynthesis
MVDFTVAIPTYNGANRLPEVLEQLREQINTENVSWEIIVVDNNSTDGTAHVVSNYQATWVADCPLRYYFEAQQGAAFARQQAVEQARGKFIGFLDDDNLPAPDWVAAAYAFGQAYPQAGAFGSQIHGDFESNPPEYLKSIACFLAIIDRGGQAYRHEPKHKILPPGAGLVVRKEAWEKAVPKRLFLNHQGRKTGLASEDLEAVLHIQQAGWEIWYNPAMVVAHKISPWRLEKDYLVSVVRCIGLSRHHLRMLRLTSWQRPLATLLYLLNDFLKLVQHRLQYPEVTDSDVVVACKRQLLVSSLMSPFFLGKKRYQEWAVQRVSDRWIGQLKNTFINYLPSLLSIKLFRNQSKRWNRLPPGL